MTPLALALQDRGHEVRVATAASFAPVVRGLGLDPVPAGLDWLESEADATFPGFTGARADALPTFAGPCAGPMARDIARLAVNWRPDVIVREHLEWGGWAAAEELGVPLIRFNLGRHIPREQVIASGTGLSCATLSDVVPAGPGPVVDLDVLTPEMIHVTVVRLLKEPSFRARARAVQAEIAAMPGPGHAAGVVESAVRNTVAAQADLGRGRTRTGPGRFT